MRVPTLVRPSVQPSRQPLAYLRVDTNPNAFGAPQARAMQGLGDAIGQLAVGIGSLQEQRRQVDRLRAQGQLTEFEVNSDKMLEELVTSAGPDGNIDETFRETFIERADGLLASAPDNETRTYLGLQLLDIYRRQQIRIQGLERQRNRDFAVQTLESQANNLANLVRSDPDRLPELLEQYNVAVTDGGFPQGGFPSSLIRTESGGNWGASNDAEGAGGLKGHFGRLQFGRARLQEAKDAGVIPQDMTPQQFMQSPEAQIRVEQWHFADIDKFIEEKGLSNFIGTQIRGVMVTQDGMRAVAHLGGKGGLERFIMSEGRYNPADREGTRLSDYLKIHAGSTARAVLSPLEVQQTTQVGSSIIVRAAIEGLIDQNPQVAVERLQSGEFDTTLTAAQKDTLLNSANARLAQNRRAQVTEVDQVLADAERELEKTGYLPDLAAASAQAAAIGGPEGEALMRRVEFYRNVSETAQQFVQGSAIDRERVLRELEAKRATNTMSLEEIQVHDLLQRLHSGIQAAAKEDGYGEAVRRGIIREPVDLASPGGLAAREAQAAEIRRAFGGGASLLTPAERESLRTSFEGDINGAYSVMVGFANTPALAADLQRALAEEGSPKSRSLSVAFSLAAQRDEFGAKAILRGIQQMKTGTPDVPTDVWIAAQRNAYGNLFEGRETLAAAYRDAAIAHYIGSREGLPAGGVPSQTELEESFSAILPGNSFNYNGRRLITPSRAIDEDRFYEILDEIGSDPEWWSKHARWYDTTMQRFDPVTQVPTYGDGTPVEWADIEDGTLRQFGLGTYQAMAPTGMIVDEGRVLILDLRSFGQ